MGSIEKCPDFQSEAEKETPWEFTPYKLRVDIMAATVLAKYAFLLALVSLILSATALFLK